MRLSERGRELRRLLEEFAETHSGDAVVAAIVPALAIWADRLDNDLAPPPDRIKRRDFRALAAGHEQLTRDDPGYPSRYYVSEGVVFQADGANHLRTAEPIMAQLGKITRPDASVRVSSRRIRRLAKQARDLGGELIEAAHERGVWLPRSVESIPAMFLVAARMTAHSEVLLQAMGARAAVIFATPNIGPRALVGAARNLGIPSVYFPHTAVLADPSFNDLPTDCAGLRGPREVDYYSRVVESPKHLEVIGNPCIEVPPMPAMDPELPPVLAPPLLEDLLRLTIEIVREGIGEKVIVSPHPRTDQELLDSLVPSKWEIWPGRTFDLLRRGPPAVMQFSSGLSLEALILGIPTIELLVPPGREISYPLIREPHVRMVSTAPELKQAFDRCLEEGASASARKALRDFAGGWAHPTGEEAARRGAALVEQAAAGPPSGAIWNAWSPPESG